MHYISLAQWSMFGYIKSGSIGFTYLYLSPTPSARLWNVSLINIEALLAVVNLARIGKFSEKICGAGVIHQYTLWSGMSSGK